MFDSHCHLAEIEGADTYWARVAGEASLSVLCCGYDEASNLRVLALRRRIPELRVALGLHPWYANTIEFSVVAALIRQAKPNAIGECGLDGSVRGLQIPIELQRQVFGQQLELACELRLPVTVHCVRTVAQVVDMVSAFPTVRGAIHAYRGSLESIRPLLARGWKVGVSGALLHRQPGKVAGIVKGLPLEALMLETDCPMQRLAELVAEEVRPHHVTRVATRLAEFRGVDVATILEQTERNARDLFERRLGD